MVSHEVPATAAAGRHGVGRRQRWLAWSVIAALVATVVAAAPFDHLTLVVIPSLYPLFTASMFMINLMASALLFIRGSIERRGDSIRLGFAYCYVCLISIPQAASFPGGLMPEPLIGSAQTPALIWCLWHIGFGLAILRYAWFAGRTAPPFSGVVSSILAAVLGVAGATYLATAGAPLLPTVITQGGFVVQGPALVWPGVAAAVTLASLVAVLRLSRTPERLWLAVGLVASCLEVWLTLRGAARYTLGWDLSKAVSLVASLTVLLSLIYDIVLLYSEAAAKNEGLEVLARIDGLTGLANRRRFDEVLQQELRRARRQCEPVSLVLLDVDRFKSYNDRYGHPMGDECLRRIAGAVSGALWRPGDLAARYGGEEMAVVLPGTEIVGAVLIAERLRSAVAALAIEHADSDEGIATVSAGVASIVPLRGDETAATVTAAADAALYQAKRGGRNRVCAAGTGQDAAGQQAGSDGVALAS
jgi:diguanylate cyclase (GGDEF)-like protein